MVQNYLFLIMLYRSRLVTWWCQKTVKNMDNNTVHRRAVLFLWWESYVWKQNGLYIECPWSRVTIYLFKLIPAIIWFSFFIFTEVEFHALLQCGTWYFCAMLDIQLIHMQINLNPVMVSPFQYKCCHFKLSIFLKTRCKHQYFGHQALR